jgi:hypothetical protein
VTALAGACLDPCAAPSARLLLLLLPQVSDFGLGQTRQRREALAASFVDSYYQKALRVYGDEVRVLRAYPGQFQVGGPHALALGAGGWGWGLGLGAGAGAGAGAARSAQLLRRQGRGCTHARTHARSCRAPCALEAAGP